MFFTIFMFVQLIVVIKSFELEDALEKMQDDSRNILVNKFETNLAFTAMKMKPTENMVVVPLLLRMSLCKLATEAHGPAKHELMKVLDYSRKKFSSCKSEITQMLRLLSASDILMVNKMYVNNTNDIDPHFMAQSAENFGVHVDKVNYNKPGVVVNYINRWFETRTYHRIKDVVSGFDINLDTSIILVSAAHIRTTWESAFDLRLTRKMIFRRLNHRGAEVEAMQKVDSFMYYNDNGNDFQIMMFNLIWQGFSITIVLPNSDNGLPYLIQKFSEDPNILQNAKSKMSHKKISLTLPKFKIKTHWNWDDALKQLGVKTIFNNDTNGLDAVLRSHNHIQHLHLSKVKQQVFVDFDEFGSIMNPGRAAEPSLQADQQDFKRGHSNDGLQVVADHPFLFMFNMQLTPQGGHNELALGTYYGP